MGALYQITFLNGKSYIGITSCSVKRRMILHLHHARKGRACALHRAIRKYGEHSFIARTLLIADDWDYLREMEKRAIQSFSTVAPSGYNLTLGGEGVLGVKRSEQTRSKLSENAKALSVIRNGLPGRIGNQATLGYHHTTEAKKKIAAANTGAIFTDERRTKIGRSKLGNKNCLGKIWTADERLRQSLAQRGRIFSDSAKMKMSAAKIGKPWTIARRVAQDKKTTS